MTSGRPEAERPGNGVRVRFGDIEATVDEAILTSSIDDLFRARFRLHLPDVAQDDPDYLAEVDIESDGESVFTGTTVDARPGGSGVAVHCASGTAMTEPDGTTRAGGCRRTGRFLRHCAGGRLPREPHSHTRDQ